MDYLKDWGFSEQDIDNIKENNYQTVLANLDLNREKVHAIIDYLLSIGLTQKTVKEIFIYQIGLFFKSLEEIKASFDEYELDSVIKSLNYDVDNVELIDFI